MQRVRSKRLEGQGRERAFDPFDIKKGFVDVFAHIRPRRDVEFHQKIKIAAGGIEFGMDFPQGDFFGDAVGCAGFAADLDEKRGAHGQFLFVLAKLAQDRGLRNVKAVKSPSPARPAYL